MIPIRNFPYSDYHDLNLDFLLKQFQQYELDIEELKRRVKALEDWREIIDPVINNLSSRVTTIEGNITNIFNRLGIVENDIVNIKSNIITINNTLDSHNTRILNNTTRVTIQENSKFAFPLRIPYLPSSPEWSDILDHGYTKQVRIDLYDINYNPYRDDFHYQTRDWYVDEESKVELMFKSLDDYEKYSDIVCGYVETEDPDANYDEPGGLGYLIIKFTEIPVDYDTLTFDVYVTKSSGIPM